MTVHQSAAAAALDYAARGLHVFPCMPDKRPRVARGFYEGTADHRQVRRWWTQWPSALIGYWPGPSGVAVLDVDRKNGKDGLATLLSLLKLRELPQTPTVTTPSGGVHLHFKMPEERIGVTQGTAGAGIGEGLDWRGDTGYVILPSPGSGYEWDVWSYDTCDPAPVPRELMPGSASTSEFVDDVGAGLDGEGRGVSIDSMAGALRKLQETKPGDRNSMLFWTSCRLVEGVEAGIIKELTAWEVLLQAAEGCGLAREEARRTIRSAFKRRPAR